MQRYTDMPKSELEAQKGILLSKYEEFKQRGLKLDMSRGKPGGDQLDLSMNVLDAVDGKHSCKSEDGTECRNYGGLDGLKETKRLFAEIFEVGADEVIVGGNSSLTMMFDMISLIMTHGFRGGKPWILEGGVKFLCPSPGYDRHFSITQYFGIEMITVDMTPSGPDMDAIEKLAASDEKIKGIWCVPKYSNPDGITYSDDTVRRLARLKPLAKDFIIMWDNAYAVHHLSDTPDVLLNILSECKAAGNPDLPVMFTSTSKISFPGAGVAAMASSEANVSAIKKRIFVQSIGLDKLNQLRHSLIFRDMNDVEAHMKRQAKILKPKFDAVLSMLASEIAPLGIAEWQCPNGGYFVSMNTMDGCAKRVVELCKEAGVVLTGAGATFPYGSDPRDRNIRIAPTFPPSGELKTAMELFCICVRLASVEKLISD